MNLSPDLLKAQFVKGKIWARNILNRKKSLVSFVSSFSISSVGGNKRRQSAAVRLAEVNTRIHETACEYAVEL